jgi:VIT1/CCC1 family predicted Fe2+/Mn2+ transporter
LRRTRHAATTFFSFIGGAIFVLVAIFLIDGDESGFSKAILGLVHNFFPGGLVVSLIGGVAGTAIFWFPTRLARWPSMR